MHLYSNNFKKKKTYGLFLREKKKYLWEIFFVHKSPHSSVSVVLVFIYMDGLTELSVTEKVWYVSSFNDVDV